MGGDLSRKLLCAPQILLCAVLVCDVEVVRTLWCLK